MGVCTSETERELFKVRKGGKEAKDSGMMSVLK